MVAYWKKEVHIQAKYAVEAFNAGQIEIASKEVLHYIQELVLYMENERKS